MTEIAIFPLYFICVKIHKKWLFWAIFWLGNRLRPHFWWFFMYIYGLYYEMTSNFQKGVDFWKYRAKMVKFSRKRGPEAKIAQNSKTHRLFCLKAYKSHFCYKPRLAGCLKTYLYTFWRFDHYDYFLGPQMSILWLF